MGGAEKWEDRKNLSSGEFFLEVARWRSLKRKMPRTDETGTSRRGCRVSTVQNETLSRGTHARVTGSPHRGDTCCRAAVALNDCNAFTVPPPGRYFVRRHIPSAQRAVSRMSSPVDDVVLHLRDSRIAPAPEIDVRIVFLRGARSARDCSTDDIRLHSVIGWQAVRI